VVAQFSIPGHPIIYADARHEVAAAKPDTRGQVKLGCGIAARINNDMNNTGQKELNGY
jgi:hypothetical protein